MKQIFYLPKQINEDLELFPEQNYITLNYLNCCNKPAKHLRLIIKKLICRNGYEVDFKTPIARKSFNG